MNRDYPLAESPKIEERKIITSNRGGVVSKTEKERSSSGGLFEPFKFKTTSIDTTGYSKGKSSYKLKEESGEGDKTGSKITRSSSKSISRKDVPNVLKSLKK
jgi:hypothetical protein